MSISSFFEPLEPYNVAWFQAINASPDASHISIQIAHVFAVYTAYILLAFLALFWFYGDKRAKTTVVKSLVVVAITLCISQLIMMVYAHPRPFVMGVGTAFLEHKPTPSFPSHHMIFFSSILFSFVLARYYVIAAFFALLSVLVAWARIYLGVHFPFDMIGALILSFFVALLCEGLFQKIQKSRAL